MKEKDDRVDDNHDDNDDMEDGDDDEEHNFKISRFSRFIDKKRNILQCISVNLQIAKANQCRLNN